MREMGCTHYDLITKKGVDEGEALGTWFCGYGGDMERGERSGAEVNRDECAE